MTSENGSFLWNSRTQAVNLELKVTERVLCFDTVRTILVISHHNTVNSRIIRNRSGRVAQKCN